MLIGLAEGFENHRQRALCLTLPRETHATPLASQTSDLLWVAKRDRGKKSCSTVRNKSNFQQFFKEGIAQRCP